METLYALSDQDRDLFRDMATWVKTFSPVLNRAKRTRDEFVFPSPDIHVAFTTRGIPAMQTQPGTGTGTGLCPEEAAAPGNDWCSIWRITDPVDGTQLGNMGQLIRVSFIRIVLVYNVSFNAIPACTWFPIAREKFGKWIALNGLGGAGSGGGASLLSGTVSGMAPAMGSVPPNTVTPVQWATFRGPFNAGGGNTRLTIPAGQPNLGIYFTAGAVIFQAIDIKYHVGAKWVAGGSYPPSLDDNLGLCDTTNLKVLDTEWFQLSPGTGGFVELVVYHDANTSISVQPVSGWIRYEGVY